MTLNNLSVLIKYYRGKSGLTQFEVAEFLKISLRTYQRIELGEASPSLETLIELSKHLKFNFSEVFKFESNASDEIKILKQSAQILEEVTRTARVGGWDFDVKENKLKWTDVTKEIHEVDLDYTPSIDRVAEFFREGESRDAFFYAIYAAIKQSKPFELQLDLTTAKGRNLNVIVIGKVDDREKECPRVYGTIQDVTELVAAKEKLKLALDELHDIHTFAGIGRWQLDIRTNVLEWSKSLFDIFEITEPNFKATYEAFLDLVHPEDRDLVNQAYTKSLQDKKPYEVEHRLLLRSGQIKWILERGSTTYGKFGEPLVSVGYALDITRFKYAPSNGKQLTL